MYVSGCVMHSSVRGQASCLVGDGNEQKKHVGVDIGSKYFGPRDLGTNVSLFVFLRGSLLQSSLLGIIRTTPPT